MSKNTATLESIALTLAKGMDLCSRVGDSFGNYAQRMLVCEAIMFRVNKDLRPLMVRHHEVIGSIVPEAYLQYEDGIITQAECISAYLACLAEGQNQEDKESAIPLIACLVDLERSLRKIYCSAKIGPEPFCLIPD